MFYTYNNETVENLPSFNANKNQLDTFFSLNNAEKYIDHCERKMFMELLPKTKREFQKVEKYTDDVRRYVEKVATKWACISATSQRVQEEEKRKIDYNGQGIVYKVNQFERLTEVKPVYRSVNGSKPPKREGEVVHTFTKRSRNRMIRKAKTMKKEGLPLPFFVTLTYHENMLDCVDAKKHLNVFLQRFRRLAGKEFRYFWKMEFQKRGAIHFHVGMFLPDRIFPKNWISKKIQYMQMRISSAWNEVAQPGDNVHLKVGTNVREVLNWQMFVGYMVKYMEKEVEPIKDDIGEIVKTGRFWGFSRNFDFCPVNEMYMNFEDREKVVKYSLILNDMTLISLIERLRENVERDKKMYSEKKCTYKREGYIRTYKAQKTRWEINKKKIKECSLLQFDLKYEQIKGLNQYLEKLDKNEFFNK